MKDENMLKKKGFDDAAVVAVLGREHRQELYFKYFYISLCIIQVSIFALCYHALRGMFQEIVDAFML